MRLTAARVLAIFLAILAVAAVGVVLWASGGGDGAGGTVAGWGDGPVAVEATAEPASVRLAVLSPGLASIVRELGREDVMVGRHTWDSWSDQGIPSVGDNLRIETEAMLAAAPGVIVVEASATEAPASLERAAAWLEAEVVRVPVLRLSDLPGAVRRMDELTRPSGADGLSAEARALLGRMEAAFREHPDAGACLGRTLVVASTGPIGVTGPGSFHWELVAALGAEAVPVTGGPWQTLNAEDVVALSPETVVLLAPGEGEVDPASRLPSLAGVMPELFEGGRVIVVGGGETMLPGPGLIGLAERLGEAATARREAGECAGAGDTVSR